MTRWTAIAVCAGASLTGCAKASGDESDPADEAALVGAVADVTIAAQPGATCALSCFEVRSSKDVGVIAVDAAACRDAAVELSLYAVGQSGATSAVDVAPGPEDDDRSCPGIPSGAQKLDGLSGKHLVLCAGGAKSARVFVKSGKTCAAKSFEMETTERRDPSGSDWLDVGEQSVLALRDVAVLPR